MDQEQIIKEQDDQLEEIEQSVKKIKENAKMIFIIPKNEQKTQIIP